MKKIVIKKGHNLIIDGAPAKNIVHVKDSNAILINPSSIKNIKVKLLVKKGDYVKNGTPLFFDKKNEKALFVSSCSGTIKDIIFGPRRIVERIEVDNDKKNESETLSKDITKDNLLKSGLWTYLRQKPYSKIPYYLSSPKSIFISAMPTEPFALDNKYLFDQFKYLQKGIDSLRKIFDCPINLSVSENTFASLNNVNFYSFNTLHPAGNVGIQIHHIDPIKDSTDYRWYLSLQDLDRMGQFFETGIYPNYKYLSIGGDAANNQAIYKILIGSPISHLQDIFQEVNSRIISGDILSGKETTSQHSINYHDEVLSIITTNTKKEFLGWLTPGLKKYSLSNTFLSKLISNKKSKLNTKKNGSVRTIIPMGNWDKVLPMDILPEFLIKNILANDIEMMEKLGIYECSPEDFALCSFVCQSKVEVSDIIESGLDVMEVEG